MAYPGGAGSRCWASQRLSLRSASYADYLRCWRGRVACGSRSRQRRRLPLIPARLVASTSGGLVLHRIHRLPVCESVAGWLRDAAVGGAVMLGLALLKLDAEARLARAALAGRCCRFHADWPHASSP